MHSLRILKKLSKRAAPMLSLLGDDRTQFRSERGDNYIGIVVMGRKHWERGRSVHADIMSSEIKRPAKDGRGWIWMRYPSHPRKNTLMVGARVGYEEPEWEEQTAWEALESVVYDTLMDFTDDGEAIPMPFLSTPTQIFAAADRLIAAKKQRSV